MNQLEIAIETFGVAVFMLIIGVMHTCQKTDGDEAATLTRLQKLLASCGEGCDPKEFKL